VPRKLQPLAWTGAIAGALWLLVPVGAPNYDTLYALVWGDELARLSGPDYGTRPPTPHPLADAWGAVVSPLGAVGATTATTVLAYLALGAIGYIVYRLGSMWFDRLIGAVAALIVLTRVPYLSNGLRAFVDLPYVALVLAALVVETRRPRAGRRVLALLALAGLLRPEAWLFSAAYLAYLLIEPDPDAGRRALRWRPGVSRRDLSALVALAAAAPLAWAAFDWVTTGDPVYSFTATRDTAELLGRHTGAVNLVAYAPHELVQTMSWAGLIAAGTGLVLCLSLLRTRSAIGLAAAVLAGAAFAVLATAGLAILSRYMLLGAALLCVFAAAALLGWRLLPGGDPWRRRWQAIAAALIVIFAVGAPRQQRDLAQVVDVLDEQAAIGSDLRSLAESGSFDRRCGPISVPGVQAVPRLAMGLDAPPSSFSIVGEQAQPSRGHLLAPADDDVAFHYGSAVVPPRFQLVARNDSWLLYARCRARR
jgi:hypothetical protein